MPPAAAALPGLLAGVQIAGLLFFLNPHLPFGAVPVLSGAFFFGSLLGLASLLVILPFTWRRPQRAARWLPWTLTAVLALAAAGAWTHAAHYSFFLPPGINRRLLKAAIWLSLAAVIGFYTALVHHWQKRPYSRQSRALFVLLATASIYVLIERREAFKTNPSPAPRASTYSGSPRPQLLVVGIEAATLDAILPLAEQGRLPFFSKMLAEGAHARLSTLHPTRRIPLWTTLATGRYPYEHGVVEDQVAAARFLPGQELYLLPLGWGFEAWRLWDQVEPTSARVRRVLALWEILARLELSTAILGWPLSAPAEGAPALDNVRLGLSERFFEHVRQEPSPKTPARAAMESGAWPIESGQRAELFKVTPREIDPEHAVRFGPRAPSPVLEALAGDLWRENLAFFLLDQSPANDALFVLLPGLREISSQFFGAYSAVQFEGAAEPQLEEAAQIVMAYYMHLDEVLARLWERGEEPRLLAVVSVYGAEPASGWRKIRDLLSRRPAHEGYFDGAPDGVLVLMGEGIRPGSRIMTAELVDLVPTLLYGLGFPIAQDLDGAVLTQAFETSFLARQPLGFLPSWETFAVPKPAEPESAEPP